MTSNGQAPDNYFLAIASTAPDSYRLFLFYCTLAFGIAICTPNVLYAQGTITWHHPDFPPSYILEGKNRGRGTVDNIHQLVFAHLTDYEHKTTVANFRRIIQTIKARRDACAIAILWNEEREKIVEYSIPHFLVHPNRIIIRKNSLIQFEPYKELDGTYSLKKTLKGETLVFGYAPGRSYSKKLDQILHLFASDKNSIVVAQNTVLEGILRMLARGRIDYTLGYAHEVAYITSTGNLGENFISLPVTGANDLIPVYTGCPKNEWGRAIIEKLNRYYYKARSSKTFYGAYLQWLDINAKAQYETSVQYSFGQK